MAVIFIECYISVFPSVFNDETISTPPHKLILWLCMLVNLLKLHFARYHAVLNLSSDSAKPSQASEAVLASTSSSDTASATAERKKRADIAAERKARIMAKMASMQQSFIKTNETFFKVRNCFL